MRVTNQMLSQDFLYNLNNNLQNMQQLQEQISTGRVINKPSDDPFKVSRAMELNSSITENNRYKTNIQEGTDWLNTTDTALGQIGDAVSRVQQLTTQAGDGALDATDKKSIGEELSQIKDQLMQIGNTTYDGRYIFGGDKTTAPPFVKNALNGSITYTGSTTGVTQEFSQGVTMDIATTGNNFSNDPSTNTEGGIFKDIDAIINIVNNNGDPTDYLDALNTDTNNILSLRSKVGAKVDRLNAMSDKNDTETQNMTDMLSKTEDVDITQAYMKYSEAQNVYTASLQAGAKILQPSLLDFLK